MTLHVFVFSAQDYTGDIWEHLKDLMGSESVLISWTTRGQSSCSRDFQGTSLKVPSQVPQDVWRTFSSAHDVEADTKWTFGRSRNI